MNPYELYELQVDVIKGSEPIKNILKEKSGRALLFGRSAFWLVETMCAYDWSGYWFLERATIGEYVGIEVMEAHIGPDAKYVKTIHGHWVRSVTIAEIFNQFCGALFDAIAMVGSGCDREIWWSDQVQAALPRLYILDEDGHNEEVIQRANERGYKATICNEMLVLVHE